VEEKKVSATSLLDVTPPPRESAPPALALADSDPNLAEQAPVSSQVSPSQAETLRNPTTPPVASKEEPVKEEPVKEEALASSEPTSSEAETRRLVVPEPIEAAPVSIEAAPVSLEEIESSQLVEESTDDDPTPLSLRDAIIEDAKPLDVSSEHETLSLRDVLIVPTMVEPDSTPPPPLRGALRTLPPTPGKFKTAAPPPTIMVEEPPPSIRPAEAVTKVSRPPGGSVPPKLPSGASVPPKVPSSGSLPPKLPSAASLPPKRSLPPPLKKPVEDDASESVRPAPLTRIAPATLPPAEEPKRSFLVPALVIGVAAVLLWRIMASPTKTPDETPTTITTASATATPSAEPSATATPSAEPSAAPSAEPAASASSSAEPTAIKEPPATTTTVTTTPRPTGTATTAPTSTATAPTGEPTEKKPAANVPVGEMSMSDMLDKAGSAKRSGDLPLAHDLYARVLKQSPTNVEANGGLGDVARAQGDLPAAKASYQRALAASPSYSPAMLGLADIEWDEGNRDAAQARYAKIVEQMRGRAPQRARDRSPAPTE